MRLSRTNRKLPPRPFLGRIAPPEFIGRDAVLQTVVTHAREHSTPLLLLSAPTVGATEFLRQVFDELFAGQKDVAPVYFVWSAQDANIGAAAQRFAREFLQQLIAFKRRDPALLTAIFSLPEILERAPLNEQEWIGQLIENLEQTAAAQDEAALLRLCLSLPQRARAQRSPVFVLFDDAMETRKVAAQGEILWRELIVVFARPDSGMLIAGLRRELPHALRFALESAGSVLKTVTLDVLSEADGRKILQLQAERSGIKLTDETRDLLIEQLAARPAFTAALVSAATQRGLALDSYRNCQTLYLAALLEGQLQNYFAKLWDELNLPPAKSRNLLRLLFEAFALKQTQLPVNIWRKRLQVAETQLQQLLTKLSAYELLDLNGQTVTLAPGALVWHDYLLLRYRLEIEAAPRAQVYAEMLADLLKRAPEIMARKYRVETAPILRAVLARFDGQEVPQSLLDYARFKRAYLGTDADAIERSLQTENETLSLPHVIHAAAGEEFQPSLQAVCEAEQCIVAHGFENGGYADENEIVWICAFIESKTEASRGLVEVWCDGLNKMARSSGFERVQLWFVTNEGFTEDAVELLRARKAFGSSRRQFELLENYLQPRATDAQTNAGNDFELVIPMGEDSEIIAAHTVEQIALRAAFAPEQINQIKTALVEACINAAEHSHSPERKIHQRFQLADDRLIITVASRGVPPPRRLAAGADEATNGNGADAANDKTQKRGWGLKLIRALMDEVEFEQADDGTRLKMTKYIKAA